MEKRKIIISDLIDTLVSIKIQSKSEEGEKELFTLVHFLNNYLQENQYMFIISNAGGHSTTERIAEVYHRLYYALENENRKYLWFYVIGDPLAQIEVVSDQFKIMRVDKKTITENIISDFYITENVQIIGAGNDVKDIDMLFTLHNLGGICYYIYDEFDEETNESLIRSISFKKADLFMKSQCSNLNKFQYEEEFFEEFQKKYNELENDYQNGRLDRKTLLKMHSFLSIASQYNFIEGTKKQTLIKDMSVLENKLILIKNKEELYKELERKN